MRVLRSMGSTEQRWREESDEQGSHMLPSPMDDRGGSMQDITVINSFLDVLGMANGSHPCDVIRSYLLEG